MSDNIALHVPSLRRTWPIHIKTAVLHTISLAHLSIAHAR